jgi:hypothetical protein
MAGVESGEQTPPAVCESILRALEDDPDGLGELRATLLKEHEWRVREGVV